MLPILAAVIGMSMPAFVMAADIPVDVPTQESRLLSASLRVRSAGRLRQPQKVAVGGEFNNWSQTEFPMKSDGAGHFVADVKLAGGAALLPLLRRWGVGQRQRAA